MALVTAIKPQKRSATRVSVFLDGRFAFGLNQRVAERFGLKLGMELVPADVERILKGQVQQDCFDKGMQYVSRRMHSRKELSQKLARAEFPADVVEAALSRMEELGYVNDSEFARQRLASAQRKLIGERRARAELMRSGVKGDVASDAIEQHFSSDEAKQNAQKLIDKNLPRLSRLDPMTAKRRLIGLLQRRGFDYETIKPLVAAALGELD